MRLEYVRHSSARMFQSNLLEAGSKVHPATPFVLYGPLVVGLLVYGLATGITRPLLAAGMFILGLLTWDAMEYAIHRAFFHWEGNGPFTRKLHDIVHGYHHKYPDDPLRAVMPVGASIPLALIIGSALYLVGKPAFTLPFYCGIVTGYMRYDFTHWYLHHRTPKTAWGKALRSHHLAHHFACPDKNFGISHRWVDVLLGSLRRR